MQQVRKSLVRWISQIAGTAKRSVPESARAEPRALDAAELEAIKGGDGGPTASPTKTW